MTEAERIWYDARFVPPGELEVPHLCPMESIPSSTYPWDNAGRGSHFFVSNFPLHLFSLAG